MPCSTDALRDEWWTGDIDGTTTAEKYLIERGWKVVGNGVLQAPFINYVAHSAKEWRAVEYLIQEWDYGVVP